MLGHIFNWLMPRKFSEVEKYISESNVVVGKEQRNKQTPDFSGFI